MKKFNFHTHSNFCDGKNSIEEMCQAAIDRGLEILGFSSHAPVPFKNEWSMSFSHVQEYQDKIKVVQELHKGKLQVFKGLEADYIPNRTVPFADWYRMLRLDYLIGGIHFVAIEGSDALWSIDGPVEPYDEGLQLHFQGNIQKAVHAYYSQMRDMVTEEKPDVVAHLDKITMHNAGRYFTDEEAWYKAEVHETLETIARHGTIVEINTRGLYRRKHTDFYPSVSIIQQCVQMGIPLTISTDAHASDECDKGFELATDAILRCGGRHIMYLHNGRWNQVALTELES